MRAKRRLSKILAISLCLQLLLSTFNQADIVYAAEESGTEEVIAAEVGSPALEESSSGEEKTSSKVTEATPEKTINASEPTKEVSAAEETTQDPEPVKESTKTETTTPPENMENTTAVEVETVSPAQEGSQETNPPAPKALPGETTEETTASASVEEAADVDKEETTEEPEVKAPERTEKAQEEEAEEKWNTTPISGQASKDGVTVKVFAPEGSFPDGTTLKIYGIDADETSALIHSIGAGQEAVAFDISFASADGEKVQPRSGYLVDLHFEIGADSILADPDGKDATLYAYHVSDNGSVEKMGSQGAPDQGSAQIYIRANNFSPFLIIKDVPKEEKRATRDAATSTDLSAFLVNVTCNAPTDENGNYIIDPHASYDITFFFRENEGLQFDNEESLVYELPEGLIVANVSTTSFDINITDREGSATISNNTFEVVDGRLIVRFNQSDPNIDRLKALGNVSFQVQLSVQIDENASSIVFNSNIEKDFVFETNSDLTIDKTVSYNMDTDTAEYVITVVSEGYNENVTVQDILSGTALTLNHDVTVTSSIHGEINPEIDYASISNGFSFVVDEMQNKEVLTIRCSAAVDNTKISSNGTVEQTQNTAHVTSDQVPDGKSSSANFAGQATFQRVSKRATGEPVQIGENLYEQTWTIKVNEDHKIQAGGANIDDWIVRNSRPFMHFSGEGLTINVTFENGTTETRIVPWSDLYLWQDNEEIWGWRYTPPDSDAKASYEIVCKTQITTEGALGDLTVVNGAQFYGSYDEGQSTIGVIGENDFSIQKDAIGTTSTESEWQITVTVPGSGLSDLRVVDDMPKLEYNGQSYIDRYIDGSMQIEGLQEGESWSLSIDSSERTFTVTFYKSETQNDANKGVLPTSDGQPRDIVIHFKTSVNQEWLDLASQDGYASSQLYRHRNYACAWSGSYRTETVNASVVPIKQDLVKDFAERSEVEIDGVTYPVFRYSLTLLGPVEDGIVIQDAFNTECLKFYEAEGVLIRGWSNSTQANDNGTATAVNTSDGMEITVISFPKQSDGSFYSYYAISYSLIAKDQEGLNAMNNAAAASQGGIDLENTATWNNLTANSVVNYTYFPYVDKELVSGASADNDYIAEFKLIINQYADDLDPTSDTLNIQDELSSNLRFVQDSLTVSPAAEGMRTQFDSETNTLIFMDVPDNTRFEITYRARVLGQGNVTYSNTVKLGNYEKTVEETAQVDSGGSGSGSNPSITLVKRDSEDVSTSLAGATFQLFYLSGDSQVAVTDRSGQPVLFTTGADGTVLISGNQSTLGWTLWEGRTYQLVETTAPVGYEINETPTEFILSEFPSNQMEYDLIGDSVTAWNTKIKTEVSVQKTWVGPAAQSVTVYLKAGETTIQTATLNEGNNWQYTFTGIDKYDANGEEIQYTVEEAPLDGYSSATEGNMAEGYVITNTNAGTIDIPVTKEWIGAAADKVIVNLLADKVPVDEAELSEESGWSHTFTGLPRYDEEDGHEISYEIEENPLDGYATQYSGTVENGFTITNTNLETIDIPVAKIWIGPAIERLSITLYVDGEKSQTVEITAEDDWSYTFTELPKYDSRDGHEIAYSIEEENLSNYQSETQGSIQEGITFKNTNTETVDIPVEKKWVGPEAGAVTIKLLADNEEIDSAELTAEESWKHTFIRLPKYDSEDGHEISYDVQEDPVTGYSSDQQGSIEEGFTITNINTAKLDIPVEKKWIGPPAESVTIRLLADGEEIESITLTAETGWSHIFKDLPKYDATDGHEIEYELKEKSITGYDDEVSGTISEGVVFTNTNKETLDVPVEKKWVGKALEQVTIRLFADGEEKESVVLTSDAEWKHTFAGLLKYDSSDGHEIEYQVKEDPVENYVTGISGTVANGFTVTNTITGKVSVPVTKVWIGPAAESVTINLLADGIKIDAVQLSAENNWQHTFTDLEQYKEGEEIQYSVEEEPGENYMGEITGNASDGYTIRNTNTETLDIPITKKWVGKALDQVKVRLFADDSEVATATLTAKDEWKHVFEGLPKYDKIDGHEIKYTIKEDAVEGYNTSVNGSSSEGFIITNTITGKISISVSKKWIGKAADSVEIYLLADGTVVQKTTLNEGNSWRHTFADLDQYKDGEEIKYSVQEKELKGYEASISGSAETGFTITNTNMETLDIPVEKKWVGQEGGSVTIRLYADGSEIDKLTLNKSGGWKSSFTGLPVFDKTDGHKISYTISEDSVEGYLSKVEGSAEKGYTVTNTQKEAPKGSGKPSSPTKAGSAPKTGDENNTALWAVLLLASATTLLLVLFKRRRRTETR